MSQEEKKGDNGQSEEAKAEPKVMEPADRLQAENLQLRIMNLELQEREAIAAVKAIRQEKAEIQREYIALRKKLEEKYQVDLGKAEVQASTGLIIPAGSTPPGSFR